MKILHAALIALFLLLPVAAQAEDTPDVAKHVFVGQTDIALPNVLGYKEIYGSNEEFDNLAKQFVPPENRLLAVYLSYTDIKAMNENPDAGFKRYILVQTAKNDVTLKTPSDFDVIKAEIIKGAGGDFTNDKKTRDLLDSASNYVSDYYHKTAQLDVGEVKNIGAFINTDKAIAIAMLANIGMKTPDGVDRQYALASAVTAVAVHDKVIFANIYSNYEGAADAQFVRDSAKDFVDFTLKANMGATATAATGGSGEMDAFLNLAIRGTFVLCIILLIGFAMPHVIRHFSKDRDERR
ncbi:MAG: hypothetical protein PW788_00975 [Micavibrio sp.]|nr:hypothetical protein [Micavibrio sp.]